MKIVGASISLPYSSAKTVLGEAVKIRIAAATEANNFLLISVSARTFCCDVAHRKVEVKPVFLGETFNENECVPAINASMMILLLSNSIVLSESMFNRQVPFFRSEEMIVVTNPIIRCHGRCTPNGSTLNALLHGVPPASVGCRVLSSRIGNDTQRREMTCSYVRTAAHRLHLIARATYIVRYVPYRTYYRTVRCTPDAYCTVS